MASDRPSVLRVVRWGSRLALALYDAGARSPTASKEILALACEINLTTLAVRQLGSSLVEDAAILSAEGRGCLEEVLRLCYGVFAEAEGLTGDGGVRWQWDETTRAKARYLLALLEASKVVLGVLTQAVHTAKVLAWAR